MARQEMFVDVLKLKQVIDVLEDEQIVKGAPAHRPFRSRNELHKAVAACDWGQAIGLTPVVVGLRIERYGIECRTPLRPRGVAVPLAPVSPETLKGAGVALLAAEGLSVNVPGDTAAVSMASVQSHRKSMYRGIDLEGFVAPFLERGLEIVELSSIMTSSLHDKSTNLKIQAAWHDLRERFQIPRFGDRPQEVTTVLPLDQVRLPGELLVTGQQVPKNEDNFGIDPDTLNRINQEEAQYEAQGWTLVQKEDLNPTEVPDSDLPVDTDLIRQESLDQIEADMAATDWDSKVNREYVPTFTDDGFKAMAHDDMIYEAERGDVLFDPEVPIEEPTQDEYIPLEEGESAPYKYDPETHDSRMFEVEETDPNETR